MTARVASDPVKIAPSILSADFADFGAECREDTPAPDGISEEAEDEDRPDPRWAGLEKFKNL